MDLSFKLIGRNQVEKALLAMARAMPSAASVGAMKGALLVEGYAKREGFVKGSRNAKQGPPRAGILTSRTGSLRQSIRSMAAGEGRAAVGPTMKYGHIHEFGGIINVQAHSRLAGGRTVKVGKLLKSGKISTKQKVKATRLIGAYSVPAYTVNMPKRPYLRQAFEKHQDEVSKAIVQGVAEGLAEEILN